MKERENEIENKRKKKMFGCVRGREWMEERKNSKKENKRGIENWRKKIKEKERMKERENERERENEGKRKWKRKRKWKK